MGVQGLTKFVSTSRSIKKLTLSKLVEEHNRLQTPLTIVVDGLALMFYMFEGLNPQLSWLSGGDYTAICRTMIDFFDAWLRHDCVEMIVVFDGCAEQQKLVTLTSRKNAYVDLCKFLFDQKRKPMRNESGRTFSIPPFTLHMFRYIVTLYRQDQLKVIQSPYEADFFMAKYAAEKHYYVLTNDSDFYIVPSAGCIALRDMVFKDGTISFTMMSNTQLAQILNLNTTELIALACLCHNDYNANMGINDFLSYCHRRYRYGHIMNKVASFIRDNISTNGKLDMRDRIFQLFERAIVVHNTSRAEQELLQVTKNTFDIYTSTAESNRIDYSWIVPSNQQSIIEEFKDLAINAGLIDIAINRRIELNILVENPSVSGAHQSWTQYRNRLYHYLFFHTSSPWRVTGETTVTVQDATVFDGAYQLRANICDQSRLSQIFSEGDQSTLQLFAQLWLIPTFTPEAFLGLLEKIEPYDWPIVCVYLALKHDIITSDSRFQFHEWELETIFSSFFWFEPRSDPQVLKTDENCKMNALEGKEDGWVSANFHHLVALFNAGLQTFDLCNMAVRIMPVQDYRGSILRYNGSLAAKAYETKSVSQENWYINNDHEKRYQAIAQTLSGSNERKLHYLAERSGRASPDESEQRPLKRVKSS